MQEWMNIIVTLIAFAVLWWRLTARTAGKSDTAELRACLDNRKQSHFWLFVGSFFMLLLASVTYLSPRWGLVHGALGVSIHLPPLWGF